MATQPTITALIERFFQEYANSSEIEKILVDPHTAINQPNQLITKQYALDNHAAAGATGSQGPIGHTGLTGATGADGPEGPKGLDGQDGAHGTGVNILGTKATSADLDASYAGAIGDMFIMLDTGYGFMWEGPAGWIDAGPIRGPIGPQGIRGAAGPAGGVGGIGPQGRQGDVGPRGAPGYTHHSQFTDRNAVNSHPYTAISDIHRVFDDRLAGFSENGYLKTASDLDALTKDGEWRVGVGAVNAPFSDSSIIVVRMQDAASGIQYIHPISGNSWARKEVKRVMYRGAWGAWQGGNILSGTANPTGGFPGDIYIQHS